jgi:polar amino acid transport system substrate-binding protein
MKKLLTLTLTVLLALTAVFGMVGCKKPGKSLTLGFDAEFPPYGYLDTASGEYKGFDLEFAKKVCDNLGYKVTFQPIDWDAKDSLLDSGAIDFIWNGFTYEGRENDYEWTVKYLNNSIVVLTNKAEITSLASLAGKNVAVQSDSSGETALSDTENTDMVALVASFKDGTYKLEASYTTAYEKMAAGAYDAIVVDFGVAKYLQSQTSGLTIIDEAVSAESYAVGFKKGNTALCKEISDEMVKVGKDAEFIQSLCTKYGVDYQSFLLK